MNEALAIARSLLAATQKKGLSQQQGGNLRESDDPAAAETHTSPVNPMATSPQRTGTPLPPYMSFVETSTRTPSLPA